MKQINIESFKLSEVTLHAGSLLEQKREQNTRYLLSLNLDRLLYNFRVYAKLDTKGVKGYGGWEGEWSDIKGEFMGHYITALCNTYLSVQNRVLQEECKDRVVYLIESLEEVQRAIVEIDEVGYPKSFGYVAAIPTTQLDCVEQQSKAGVFSDGVPYYVHHKMFRGLLHACVDLGLQKAGGMAIALAQYFYDRNEHFSTEQLERMLNSYRYPVQYFKEFGGMQEVMVEWYGVTGNVVFEKLAQIFDRPSFHQALIQNQDRLGERMQHANSEIPCVVGMAKHYELYGDEDYQKGVLNFLDWMEDGHTTPIGGISGKSAYPDYNAELFHYPHMMYNHMVSDHLSLHSGESCCSHNMNLLNEYAFNWTGDKRYMDQFEKRFVNAVLGQQDTKTGMFLYHLDLHPNSKKEFGTPDDSFWCCYCSGIEAYSSLQYGAFQKKDNTLWVNQFISADVYWKEQDFTVSCETAFPTDGKVILRFSTQGAKQIQLRIRKPDWVTKSISMTFNGNPASVIEQDGYFILDQLIHHDDVLQFELPFTLTSGYLMDRPNYGYLCYGPHLLVACGYNGETPFLGTLEQLKYSLKSTGYPREFYSNFDGRVVFMPISEVRNESYSGFVKVSEPTQEVLTDVLDLNRADSQKQHALEANNLRCVQNNCGVGIETEVGGYITCTMAVDAQKPMQLRCHYNGDDTHFFAPFDAASVRIRLFDIQVEHDGNFVTFATQTVDHLKPGCLEYINYPIPVHLTKGKQQLNLRFISKDFGTAKGIVGGLYQCIELFYLS